MMSSVIPEVSNKYKYLVHEVWSFLEYKLDIWKIQFWDGDIWLWTFILFAANCAKLAFFSAF